MEFNVNQKIMGFKQNDWVKVMMPNIVRSHCLSVIDVEFAHAYCGRSFPKGELALQDDENNRKCPSCLIKYDSVKSNFSN